jgi:hypothetical protein
MEEGIHPRTLELYILESRDNKIAHKIRKH